jgi:hypothetical protein
VIVGTSGVTSVASGGTGAATLTANNVILGNGTSAVQFVAPGSNGNVLTSNGTTWSSAAAPSSTPTTAQVLTATSGYTAGVVGSFATGYSGSGAQANNATVAGSTLTNAFNANIGFSGTWRCLTFASAGGYITNWVRSA